jgi:glyoxylase-like metal-dependent hydrolase (beta-lactamase superfamily II)
VRAGRIEVIALVDAVGPFFEPRDAAFSGATDADWAAARRLDPDAFGADGSWQLAFRCFALRHEDGRVVLVDAGVGPAGSPAASWAPVPGGLPAALSAADIVADEVETVVLTHLHADHVGWVVDADRRPMFARATYLLQEDELAHVRAAGAPAVWEHAVRPLLDSGQLDTVRGRTQLGPTDPGDTITLVPTPGHTVGHQSVLVESGDRRVLVTGDALVNAVQLVDPAVAYRFEHDPAQAAETRRALLDTGVVVASAHLGDPFVEV